MTTRQKLGIGMLVSGALFLLCGVVFLTLAVTPAWVGAIVLGAGAVCEVVLGVTIAKPVI